MRAPLSSLVVVVALASAACTAPTNAVSASLVDDVLHAEVLVVESFAERIEQQGAELRVTDPTVVGGGGVTISTGKAGAKVKVGGIEVGGGKVVVPGVATIGAP